MTPMNVGIIGLGLIGGSFAKAYKSAGHTVLAAETDKSVLDFALLSGVVDKELSLTEIENNKQPDKHCDLICDLIIIALYPAAAIEFINRNAARIGSGTLVIDCCGTKKNVCETGFSAAAAHGFTFVGGHPMAGSEQTGFKHSRANMFRGAPMIIVPPRYDDMAFLEHIKSMLAPAEFGRLTVTTAEKHDTMIAYTSQLAHIVSNAFIKSPVIREHKGYSAGSYKDLTRVAWLNEAMWTELFFENRAHLLPELDHLINSLCEYQSALRDDKISEMTRLLIEGKRIKEETDRR